MDWYLSGGNPAAATDLRHQVRDYLNRHSKSGSDIGDAELIVQELVANALEHATGPVWVHLSWLADQPELVVRDLGPGFAFADHMTRPHIPVQGSDAEAGVEDLASGPPLPDPFAEGAGGCPGDASRSTARGGRPPGRRQRGGGQAAGSSRPVAKYRSASDDLRRTPVAGGSESGRGVRPGILSRALLVQFAQAVELTGGPDLAEDAVARVGAAVGGQMEAEYRAAKRMSGRLTQAQLIECLVTLKHAISGGFYPLEVTEHRIVLGNDRCPFGLAVRKSPALCRMTSSVFGGIAARNADDVSVVLEERIAVGDPGCRVVIYFGDPPEPTQRFAHRYRGHVRQESTSTSSL